MKHAFDRFIHYLQKNYFSYWVVLGIDTFIALLYLGVIYWHSLYYGNFQRNSFTFPYLGGFSYIECFGGYSISYLS